MDRLTLRSWIQPQHLTDQALAAYSNAFTAHPARLLVIKRFLLDDVAARLSRFLSEEAAFVTEYGLASVEGAVSADQWSRAQESDRFFRLGKLVGTPPQFRMSSNALTYLRFRQAFQGKDLREFFEAVSCLSLGWSDDFGAHAMRAGDFLRPHSDDNRNRRLALVLYLSPDWDPSFGGALHVTDEHGRDITIEAEYNSVIAFDVTGNTAHFVAPVQHSAGDAVRLTIGGWYHRVAERRG